MNMHQAGRGPNGPPRCRELLRLARAVLAATLAIVATTTGITAVNLATTALPAGAATTGAGYAGITPFGGYLGNYIGPDGSRIYCIDSSADWPSGDTIGPTLVGGLANAQGEPLSAVQLQKLNYALLSWGQTADPTLAAAVSAYIYAYTSTYAHFNGQGYAAGANYIDGNQAVLAVYNAVWNQAETNYAGAGSGSAALTIVMANSYDGSVTVTTSPTNATGTLTLTGATVVATGLTTATVTNGSVIPIKGAPLNAQNKYSITANATFTAPGGAGANVNLFTTSGQQRTIRGGTPGTLRFSARTFVTDPLPLEFSPIVTTQVASQFVQPGHSFVDTVVADVAAGSAPWRRRLDLSYLTIVAHGTLYGPFTDKPTPSALPPAAAPVIGTETLNLTGPGTYSSPGTLVAPEAGYYTWVWTIDAADQEVLTRAQIPADYHFADQFGLVAETHIVPITLTAVSAASATEIGLSGTVNDQLTVLLNSGSWLTVAGVPVPAVFDGTAYFVPGDTPPAIATTIPSTAVVVGTATVTAPGPGVYPASAPATAPSSTAGYITWVWKLSSSSANSRDFLPWTDLFGLPAETTRVAPPTVGTVAVAAAAIGNPVHDTAMVGGTLPAQPGYLVFEAYLQATGAPVCDASNLAFTSSNSRVSVTTAGAYPSPSTSFLSYGTYFWVASLFSFDDQLINRGQCGAAGESTLVSPAEVTTKAAGDVVLGTPAHDTATVTGLVPTGATLIFNAYLQSTPEPVCNASTLVFTTQGNPLALATAGDYDSASTVFTKPGTYYWVETLRDRNDNILHVGKCGTPLEVTVVKLPTLALTGLVASAMAPLLLEGSGLLLAIGVVALVLVARRRTRPAR